MKIYRIKQVIRYGDRDYAILYTSNVVRSGEEVPLLDYRPDKNHEEHAVNSFIKQARTEWGAAVTDEREQPQPLTEQVVRVTIESGGKRFSTEIGV